MSTKPKKDYRLLYGEVGGLIQKVRTSRNMTQETLAEHISLSRTSVTNIERGEQKFLLHTLMDIAQALQVPPASLLPERYQSPQREIDAVLTDTPREFADWIKLAVGQDGKDKGDGSPT
jgi:transcriptional regulator with XRE-family HTH domain